MSAMYFAHTADRRTSSASSTSIAHASPPTSARLLGANSGFTAEWKPVVSRRLADALASLSPPSSVSLPAGKRSARSTEHDDRVARFRASSELASELSLRECARAVAATTTRVARNMDAAADALLYTFITWTAGYIVDAVRALRRLRRFAGPRAEMDGITLSSFLQTVHQNAVDKATASPSKTTKVSEVTGFVRFGASGTTAANKVLLVADLGFELWHEWVPSKANISDVPSRDVTAHEFLDHNLLRDNQLTFVFPTPTSLWTALPALPVLARPWQ